MSKAQHSEQTILMQSSVFILPPNLEAREPPEVRGVPRSDVKLLVIKRSNGEIAHSKFQDLRKFLNKEDLLVFNSSRTLPASLLGRELKSGKEIEVRLAEHLADDSYLVLLLDKEKKPLHYDGKSIWGIWIDFGGQLSCNVLSRDTQNPILWRARFSKSGSELTSLIYELGKPIRYEHVPHSWNIDYYQNIYADKPGSSEMPSAGRAFTWKMIFDLRNSGIETANILLHTGLSSYMDENFDAKHPVSEEEFSINSDAARKINEARIRGNRIVAIGTTVVRALESASRDDGTVRPSHSYTRLHISEQYKLKSVNGLLTGLHESHSSHLDLLRAFLPNKLMTIAYNQAIEKGYLWHEFGDLNLII
jgi:S-adenosylmethionine:tRNA ribosyltransferase-isomerase